MLVAASASSSPSVSVLYRAPSVVWLSSMADLLIPRQLQGNGRQGVGREHAGPGYSPIPQMAFIPARHIPNNPLHLPPT